MKSVIIGISRPGDPDGIPLIDDSKYVSRCGSFPEVTFSIGCKQTDFFDHIKELRYDDNDPSSSAGAISFFQDMMRSIFKKFPYINLDKNDKTKLHIRLITTPMEIAQLPFEFVPAPWTINGNGSVPLLANDDRMITLTREVLLSSEARYVWPKQPRVLFAWAEPTASVPHDLHREAIVDALYPLIRPKDDKPYPEPDTAPFFTELPNASLTSIKKEIEEAIKNKKPYSHIHLLAHGGHIVDFEGIAFRLVVCNDEDPALKGSVRANGAQLTDAIIPAGDGSVPIVVTLSACDSGNSGNVLMPAGSLVYQLHRAGIPCVFASQFPLTQEGSVELVKTLYKNLIKACDPREALYEARIALVKNKTHDWASLLAYARFPEDIDEQLHAIELKMRFSGMKTTTAWIDHVLKNKDQLTDQEKKTIFQKLNLRLEIAIEELSAFLTPDKESTFETNELKSEHLGLIGSAYKRKAEFLFRIAGIDTPNAEKNKAASLADLKASMDFYFRGYDTDINNQWVTMQYLSLKVVMGNSAAEDKILWEHIYFITENKRQKETIAEEKMKAVRISNGTDPKEISESVEKLWTWGTLLELHLIKPFTVDPELIDDEMITSLAQGIKFAEWIRISGNGEIIDSTARQLDRYISWWPQIFSGAYMQRLKKMATEIRNQLLK